jgi:predicted permease
LILLTLGVSVLAGIAAGLRPALESARKDLAGHLSAGRRTVAGGLLGQRFRRGLVTVQIALSVVLLMGGGLLIRSFLKLQSVNLGFDPNNVLLAGMSLPRSRYPQGQQAISLYEALLNNLSSRSGVDAAVSTSILLSRLPNSGSFSIEGKSERISMPMTMDSVSPSFFQVLRIPLRRGRFFTNQDRAGSLPVAIINETAANRYWPNQDPIGKRFTFDNPSESPVWLTIVGVVADTRRAGLENPVFTESYQPLAQRPRNGVTLIVRGRSPGALPSILRSELRSQDAKLPIFSTATLQEVLATRLAPRRFNTVLLGLFAATALLLAAIGVYGILAQFVAARQREIGIRLAVGADRRHVIGTVVGYGLWVLGVGLALGMAGAFASARLLSGLLYGVETWDSLTIGVVVVVLATAVTGASLFAALKAIRIDPLTALRSE